MGLSEETEDIDRTRRRFEDLCMSLNMDNSAKDAAAIAYERMRTHYTLEGDSLHWLACALYVSCRMSVVPTVGGQETTEGNCVCLTRLLRSANLSLLEFFKKIKKWADMASLPQEFRDKVDRLERSFAVSMVIFKKYQPIFTDVFRDPANERPRPPHIRKPRRVRCSVTEVFKFCWTMFVQVKGNYFAISDDLVNSYHLLLCCVDWFYANAIVSNRKDLLNPNFPGLPAKFSSADYKPATTAACIMEVLCKRHEGIEMEAKVIKEHWWRSYTRRLFLSAVLKGNADNQMGVIEIGTFEANSKAINNEYELWVLNKGDFDERIFLGEDATAEIGTPAKTEASTAAVGELPSRSAVARGMRQFDETRALAHPTPLTGRHYLADKEAPVTPVTPVSTATQSVGRLQSLLASRHTSPSETLLGIFKECSRNPLDDIVKRVHSMGQVFCSKYSQRSDADGSSHEDFARRRLQLADCLYFKTLERVMLSERRRLSALSGGDPVDLSALMEQDIFHRSLIVCCLEIVIFSYNSLRTFPWVMKLFDIDSYSFYKVIEIVIRAEDGLSRDVVKHLNQIEESILECGAWSHDSPLWDAISQQHLPIPSVGEVSLPGQIETDIPEASPPAMNSPIMHPAVRRITGVKKEASAPSTPVGQHSPLPVFPVTDIYGSPTPGSVKRRLFAQVPGGGTDQVVTLLTEDGRQVMVIAAKKPPPIAPPDISHVAATDGAQPSATVTAKSRAAARPKRTGSLGLFFRKVYHLGSVRLRELCERLGVDSELRSQMWTCFEYCLVHHIELMRGRHLDQLVMCAVYVVAKVTGKDKSFQDIMRCYRLQPQARSHVYRSVLLSLSCRRSSGDSENTASGASSPAETTAAPDDSRSSERLALIRSSSALPEADSRPPTPTRLAGTGSATFEFEDRGENRGDLIKFYNSVYVEKIRNFALKFSTPNGVDSPVLSPLPVARSHQQSPRRVSAKHPVYVSPHKSAASLALSPRSKLLYCFNKSPCTDLRAINNMLRKNERSFGAGKRLALAEDRPGPEATPGDNRAKRFCSTSSPLVNRRLEQVVCDRRAASSR